MGEGFIHVRRIAVTTNYTAPLSDIRFCLYDLLDVEKLFAKLPGCESL
ncbi:MAG: acyl-CoA dehydrogenase N-terminal domain-containing protein, partial [Xanthomonadaceae bacterium]|nr:acyl-CoA dehydrogenase N-terminal domain-containing protein [Xanthomonadaceae bacterium]